MELKNKIGIAIVVLLLSAFLVAAVTNKVFVNTDFNQMALLNISNVTMNGTFRANNFSIINNTLSGVKNLSAQAIFINGIAITATADVNKTYVDSQDLAVNNSAKNWTLLQNYPAACPAYSALSAVDDSNTCVDSWLNNDGDNATGNYDFTGNITANKFVGDGSSLTGLTSTNFTLYGNTSIIATADVSGGCTNRPFTSTEALTITINTGSSVQTAICTYLPYFLRHRLTINIDGDYTGMENITIPSYVGEQSTDYSGGQLRIRSVFGEGAKIGSIFASGITGQANPYFEGLNVTGYHPYYTGKCQACFFGVTATEMYNMVFSGNPSNNVYGVTCYGSTCKVSDTYFGNGTQYALEVKQGGRILATNITGYVTKTPFFASQGDIFLDLPATSSIEAGTGYDRYKKLIGAIYEQAATDYTYERLVGINSLPSLTDIQFNDEGEYWEETGNSGIIFYYNKTNNKLYIRSRTTAGVISDRIVVETGTSWGIGINKTNPSDSDALDVSGSVEIAKGAFTFWGSTSPANARFIKGSGAKVEINNDAINYDTEIQFSNEGVSNFSIGVDASDEDFKISRSGDLETNTVLTIADDTGLITIPTLYASTSFVPPPQNTVLCNATNAGRIAYNSTTFKHVGCNSTNWVNMY